MSSELVPLSYGRAPYNILHGTESETHTDALTPEQAAQINDNYDIQIYLGRHGSRVDDLGENPLEVLRLPTQLEYDEAAAVVDALEPGDTMYCEALGFRRQSPDPKAAAEKQTPMPSGQYASFSEKWLGWYTRETARLMMPQLEQATAKLGRLAGTLSAWDYLNKTAAMKGVRIVKADYDAFEDAAYSELSKSKFNQVDDNTEPVKDIADLVGSPDPEEHVLGMRANPSRERAARNILKDDALAHLPPEGTPPRKGQKPKLVLVFGSGHTEGLQQAFDDVGLKATVNIMQTSEDGDRFMEQYERFKTDEERVAFVTRMIQEANRMSVLSVMNEMDSSLPVGLPEEESPRLLRKTIYTKNVPREFGRTGLRGIHG